MVPMDRAWQDWVYEYAERGRPLAARTLQEQRREAGRQILRIRDAKGSCKNRWSNGPAGNTRQGGHNLSQIGPLKSAASPASSAWPAAHGAGRRALAVAQASFRLSAHSFPCPSCASPSSLAVVTVSSPKRTQPDGKVRWQKKFAFPARRMRRGLRF